MSISIHKILMILYRAGRNLGDNHGMEMAGYLTFLSLLALFPYLVLIISVAGWLGQGVNGAHFLSMALSHLPSSAVATIRPRIEEIISGPPQGLLTFSILGAIWTASSGVEAVRGVLNRAYQVRKPPTYFTRRLLSVGQLLIFTTIILMVMISVVFAPVALDAFTHMTGIAVPLLLKKILSSFLFFGVLALFFMVASLYHILPNIKQDLWAVLPGALLVILCWLGGAGLVSYYINTISQVSVIYGSLSGFIATLIFFYVMIVIFIYGAEFNHQLLVAFGRRIVEKEVPENVTLH